MNGDTFINTFTIDKALETLLAIPLYTLTYEEFEITFLPPQAHIAVTYKYYTYKM